MKRLVLIVVVIISMQPLTAQDGSEIISAVNYQDLDKVKELVEAGVDINYQDESYGTTALILSCQYNFANIAKYLIEAGADHSVKSKSGHTALIVSARSSEELFELLLSKGADISAKVENGTTAFTFSIIGVLSDDVGFENAKKLLKYGADVDEKQSSGRAAGYTCLMMAARNQRPDIVNFLVENGADVNAKAENGNTPLSLAEKEEDQEMIALLKKLGAK